MPKFLTACLSRVSFFVHADTRPSHGRGANGASGKVSWSMTAPKGAITFKVDSTTAEGTFIRVHATDDHSGRSSMPLRSKVLRS